MANAEWLMEFMSYTLNLGRRFRTLNILDEGVREALDIVIDTSIPSGRVVRTLDQLLERRGKPEAIRDENDVDLKYIQPGKPNQNAYIGRFNRTYRNQTLNASVFESLSQVREITHKWIKQYNEERPHSSLGQIPPTMFRRQVENARNFNFELSH